MKTLIIYNKETGEILFTRQGGADIETGSITNMTVEVPEDKVITGVNVKTKELIMEDKPKSETQLLQEKVEKLENNMAELMLEMATQRGNKQN